MKNPVVELSRNQIVTALMQFPPDALKKVIDDLFRKKLYTPRPLNEIAGEASAIVKQAGLGPETVDEAVRWARFYRSQTA